MSKPSKTALPAVVSFHHQPELRALLMLPSIPPGHMTFLVKDNAFFPHLHEGEFAIVDLADHRPAHGEMFVISYNSQFKAGGKTFELCQLRRRDAWRMPDGSYRIQPDPNGELVDDWVATHQRAPRDREEQEAWMRSGRVICAEGPFTTSHIIDKLVGRIVGVFLPTVGAERAPSQEAVH